MSTRKASNQIEIRAVTAVHKEAAIPVAKATKESNTVKIISKSMWLHRMLTIEIMVHLSTWFSPRWHLKTCMLPSHHPMLIPASQLLKERVRSNNLRYLRMCITSRILRLLHLIFPTIIICRTVQTISIWNTPKTLRSLKRRTPSQGILTIQLPLIKITVCIVTNSSSSISKT